MRKSSLLTRLTAATLVLAACTGPAAKPAVTDLTAAEITEYQGEDLSSVNDFRENSISGVQNVSLEGYRLTIDGEVETPLALTYDEVLAKPAFRKVITLHCVEGWDATILWEGARIMDLLDQASVKPGAVMVIFHAADGYTSSLPLAYIRDHDILLAYKMNDILVPAARGFPFVVAAESKWGYKWVKWVTRIELSTDPNYKGFWEQRGYNNNGDQSGSQLEP